MGNNKAQQSYYVPLLLRILKKRLLTQQNINASELEETEFHRNNISRRDSRNQFGRRLANEGGGS